MPWAPVPPITRMSLRGMDMVVLLLLWIESASQFASVLRVSLSFYVDGLASVTKSFISYTNPHPQ